MECGLSAPAGDAASSSALASGPGAGLGAGVVCAASWAGFDALADAGGAACCMQPYSAKPAVSAARPLRSRQLNLTASWYHARLARAAWALVLAAVVGSAACAETARGPLAGASDAWANGPEASPAPSARAPLAQWDAYAEVQRWPAANSSPFTSQGHQPEQSVIVHVSEAARASYAALVTDTVFPDGTLLAELPTGAGGLGYAMHKVGNAWTYTELDARGGVLASGNLPLCAACHAQTPSDSVFGLPRAPSAP